VAAIGLAAGGGLYFAATVSTGIILVILAGLKPLEDAYRARVQSCKIKVVAERGTLSTNDLAKLVGVRPSQLKRVLIQETDADDQQAEIQLARVSTRDIHQITSRLRREPGVHEVKVGRQGKRKFIREE
jgi:putative Mg2+ transporter-C (MgtC) family protein